MKFKLLLSLLIAILVFPILFQACSKNVDKAVARQWSNKEMHGLIISLIDEKIEQWYKFNKNGSVSLTFGIKNGELTFPLYFWKISHGQLIIFDDEDNEFERFSIIARSEGELILLNKSKETRKFKIISLAKSSQS